jgi:hypothetical protein
MGERYSRGAGLFWVFVSYSVAAHGVHDAATDHKHAINRAHLLIGVLHFHTYDLC